MLGHTFDMNFASQKDLSQEWGYQATKHFKSIMECLPKNVRFAMRSRAFPVLEINAWVVSAQGARSGSRTLPLPPRQLWANLPLHIRGPALPTPK